MSEIDRDVLWFESNGFKNIFDHRSIGKHNLVTVNEKAVEEAAPYKYLGVLFDTQLKWDQYGELLYSRISQRLHFLRWLRVLA